MAEQPVTITVEVSPWMRAVARSRFMVLIPVCGGVACSFSPFLIYESGLRELPPLHPWVMAHLAIVYAVLWVGMLFGMRLIWALRR